MCAGASLTGLELREAALGQPRRPLLVEATRLATPEIYSCFHSQFQIFQLFACVYQYFEGLAENDDKAGGDLPDREPPMFPPHSVFLHAPSKVNIFILVSKIILAEITKTKTKTIETMIECSTFKDQYLYLVQECF